MQITHTFSVANNKMSINEAVLSKGTATGVWVDEDLVAAQLRKVQPAHNLQQIIERCLNKSNK